MNDGYWEERQTLDLIIVINPHGDGGVFAHYWASGCERERMWLYTIKYGENKSRSTTKCHFGSAITM